MKIGIAGRLVTLTSLGTIVLIAAMAGWAHAEVQAADAQRRRAGEITRALSNLRLVTFEYILHRPQRALAQHRLAAAHLERLLSNGPFMRREAVDVLGSLRERHETARHLFAELAAAKDDVTGAGAYESFQAQVTNRLLLQHQESAADAFRLLEFSGERITQAQRRLALVILGGLALMSLTTGTAAWLIHRKVLAPIRRVEAGTREVAAGNLTFSLGIGGDDEIAGMARAFDAMTNALRTSFAQIERNNRELASLNQEIEAFSYSVSHDLRAPLRSMDGFSLALIEDYADKLDDQGRDNLLRIRGASQRMGRLIDDLLGLARVTRTELKLGAVDLSAMAHEIAEALQQREPQRRVQWRIEDGITVCADRALLHIALTNLLENAWKFTAKTGEPVIRVACVDHDGRRACMVSDNGAGFDMAYADRLFGAFQRMHQESEFPGTGIGLAIVQRIFHRHGAGIWAQSAPGHGAAFYFQIRDATA